MVPGHTDMRCPRGFTLVELMIAVAVIGVLAAIAIPAFQKYIDRSRYSEAEEMVAKITDGAKSYFTADQSNCGAVSECAEPWHNNSSRPPGIAVEWSNKVFPGGNTAFDTAGGDPPPAGSDKYQPVPNASAHGEEIQHALNLSLASPLYFKYTHNPSGSGNSASATVTAEADFNPASSEVHTYRQTIDIQSGSVVATPPVTQHSGE